MLAHLDALCAAMLARNAIEIYRLLGLPDARKLPRIVREEAIAIAKAGPDSFLAPVQALHLYYKLSHLVDEYTEIDETPQHTRHSTKGSKSHSASGAQMEMQFRTRKVG